MLSALVPLPVPVRLRLRAGVGGYRPGHVAGPVRAWLMPLGAG